MAYLAMMAPRLVELRRVLKPTGSLYLHCDPTASHYLKLLCDAVFGPGSFINEIIWKRSSAHNDHRVLRKNPRCHSLYTKDDEHLWNTVYTPAHPRIHRGGIQARPRWQTGEVLAESHRSQPRKKFRARQLARHNSTAITNVEQGLGGAGEALCCRAHQDDSRRQAADARTEDLS